MSNRPKQEDIDQWIAIINRYKKEFKLKNNEIERLSQDMAAKYINSRLNPIGLAGDEFRQNNKQRQLNILDTESL